MSIAKIKADARRALHRALSVSATWRNSLTGDEQAVTVRWHDKMALRGELSNEGYAQIIDTQDRLIFNMEELDQAGITLERSNLIIMPPEYNSTELQLEEMEQITGPIEQVWQAVRVRG